jgi:hypothetical protein
LENKDRSHSLELSVKNKFISFKVILKHIHPLAPVSIVLKPISLFSAKKFNVFLDFVFGTNIFFKEFIFKS